jgi:hypothetical protein
MEGIDFGLMLGPLEELVLGLGLLIDGWRLGLLEG